MRLLLHRPKSEQQLSALYKKAFADAVELFIVTAFLTEWDKTLKLNKQCRGFRLIVGKDFGITRKAACEAVLRWLPSSRKTQFMVADGITGFHPKAIFWKDSLGRFFAVIGSSNLTRAAFETNFEANIFSPLLQSDYEAAKQWVKSIETRSVPVSEDWLEKYKEAPMSGGRPGRNAGRKDQSIVPLESFKLPRPPKMREFITRRQKQLSIYEKKQAGLMRLFRRCAKGDISSEQFYEALPKYWSYEVGDRLQGAGFERKGKSSDFQELARSFLNIIAADKSDRDDVVVEELDRLTEQKVAARRAFLSEMLCLKFPYEYPVLNAPVKAFLTDVRFRAPRGASFGAIYIDLAKKLRFSLLQNQGHPARNLAELDTVIWLAYGAKEAHVSSVLE